MSAESAEKPQRTKVHFADNVKDVSKMPKARRADDDQSMSSTASTTATTSQVQVNTNQNVQDIAFLNKRYHMSHAEWSFVPWNNMPLPPRELRAKANVAPDVDLWLIKVPNDFELKELDGQVITVRDGDDTPIPLTSSTTKQELTLAPITDNTVNGVLNAFPSSRTLYSTLGKPFERMFTLQSRSSFAPLEPIYRTEFLNNRHIPSPAKGLRRRYKPIGSSDELPIPKPKSTKRVKKSSSTKDEQTAALTAAETPSVDATSSTTATSTKKHKRKRAEVEQEAAPHETDEKVAAKPDNNDDDGRNDNESAHSKNEDSEEKKKKKRKKKQKDDE